MQEVHLLVLAHGLWGEPAHMSEIARVIGEKYPPGQVDEDGVELRVLVAETNAFDSTYDGVDWGGERIVDEVQRLIKDIASDGQKRVTRFSVVGYSLGGLMVRYVIGILESRNFFDTVKPVNFTTFATPHIGLIKMDQFWSKISFKLGPKMLSRTGPQFYCTDSWSTSGQPLLEVMADPKNIFYRGLAKFQNLNLYGSVYGDKTVSYQTSLIEAEDPFYNHEETGIIFKTEDAYPHLVCSYEFPSRPPTPPPKPPVFSQEYLKSTVSRIRLPPYLQARFPLNVVIYTLLPLLIPAVFTAAYIKISLDSSNSRKRIKVLEKDEGFKDRLVNVFHKLDKQMENVIVEIIEEAGEQSVDVDETTGEPLVQLASTSSRNTNSSSRRSSSEKSRSSEHGVSVQEVEQDKKKAKETTTAPTLSELQHKLAASLNTLPFNKYRAHFPGVFNAHSVIISRDIQRFAFHKQGESILRHWADHFTL